MSSRRRFLRLTLASLLGTAAGSSSAFARVRGKSERTHIVQRGDTLGALAQRYGVTVAALRQRNAIRGDTIVVGQKLIIPPASADAGPPAIPTALKPVIFASNAIAIQRGRWKYVVAHHSGIEDGNARSYDREHRRRGYENGLAYHFVIGNGRDSDEGEIEIGNRWFGQIQGGHVRDEYYNEHGIGVCLVGNFENRAPSQRQLASFTALVDWLRTDAPLGIRPAFTVHRWVDRNHTVCPGKYFPFDTMKLRYPS